MNHSLTTVNNILIYYNLVKKMLIFYLFLTYKNPALFTVTAAVAVSRAIQKKADINVKIKWVNDLYLENKKICGILAEGIFL